MLYTSLRSRDSNSSQITFQVVTSATSLNYRHLAFNSKQLYKYYSQNDIYATLILTNLWHGFIANFTVLQLIQYFHFEMYYKGQIHFSPKIICMQQMRHSNFLWLHWEKINVTIIWLSSSSKQCYAFQQEVAQQKQQEPYRCNAFPLIDNLSKIFLC